MLPLATLATDSCYNDLSRLLVSISIFNPDNKIYLLCDTPIHKKVLQEFPFLNIEYLCTLDCYANKNRNIMEKEGIWLQFMLEKCTIVDFALTKEKEVLFLDADIILFNSVDGIIDQTKDIGLSKHEIVQTDEIKYGKYNGGFFYVQNKDFTTWWKKASKKSSFFEQKAMDDIPSHFSTFFFPPQNNFGWWRLCQAPDPNSVAIKFTIKDGLIYYEDQQLNSIHTHLISDFNYTVIFNNFILNLVKISDNPKYKIITL